MDTKIDIKALRTRLGWSQGRMAEYLGVDRSTVSRMESVKPETAQPQSGPVRRLLAQLYAANERRLAS